MCSFVDPEQASAFKPGNPRRSVQAFLGAVSRGDAFRCEDFCAWLLHQGRTGAGSGQTADRPRFLLATWLIRNDFFLCGSYTFFWKHAMKRELISLIIVLALAFLCFYLFYQILLPFLRPLLWAVFLALVLFPTHRKLQRLLRTGGFLPAMVMTILVILVIVLPFSFLMVSLGQEAKDAYHAFEEMIQTGRLQATLEQIKEFPVLKQILSRLDQTFNLSSLDPIDFILKNLQQISVVLLNQSSRILKGVSGFLIAFLFTLLSLYYLFKDGERLFDGLKGILPIPPRERDLLIDRFQDMVNATIFGGLLIAIIQGLLGGLAFWALGAGSPILWGTAMALFSFIPLGGTALIWVPAAVLFIISGAMAKGIILLAVGVFIISSVDNFLRPLIVGVKTHIHPLLLFFTVIGGIQVFGMIGIITGPLIASLCLTLIEIYLQGGQPASSSDPK
jgi:predicted PurR-regulated permease PerM